MTPAVSGSAETNNSEASHMDKSDYPKGDTGQKSEYPTKQPLDVKGLFVQR